MPSTPTNGSTLFLENGDYDANDIREYVEQFALGQGAMGFTHMRVVPSAGMTISIGVGDCMVRGPGDGSLYKCQQTGSAAQLTLLNANGTNPRLDQIICHVYDDAAPGDISNQFIANFETIEGAPTAGATLDNRNGAPDPQASLTTSKAYIPLADVLVPAGATSISAANIRDRRPFAQPGMCPPLATSAQTVLGGLTEITPLMPIGGATRVQLDSTVASKQSAALFWLNRRIPATRLRWSYYNGDTNGANPVGTARGWNFGIYDASGRQIANTGTQTFSGGVGPTRVSQLLNVPYAGYAFEPGPIIVAFGVGALTATEFFSFMGAVAGSGGSLSTGFYPPAPNMFWANQTGGTVLPTTILAFGDAGVTGGLGSTQVMCVPQIALSVL